MPLNPVITDYAQVGDLPSLGTTVLTEMAKAFEQFPGDEISQFFAPQMTNDQTIIIERVRRGVGIAPLVNPGQPDAMTDSALVDRRVVTPAHIRESDFIPAHVVNNLRQVGTLNEKVGKEFVADRIQRLTERSNFFFAVMRAQALLGGINFTDPRTGASINVNMQIPAANFRTLVPLGAARTWDNTASATPVRDLSLFKQYMYQQAKTRPTHIVMRSKLKMLLNLNAEILRRQETAGVPNSAGFLEYRDGEIFAINGMKILICDTLYDDPITGTKKFVWPIEKVACVAMRHEQAPGESVGRMTYTVGEDPMGRPGMWMRSGPDTAPPSPPGRSVQMGNSGLPWLKYPDWVGILTVGTPGSAAGQLDYAVDTAN